MPDDVVPVLQHLLAARFDDPPRVDDGDLDNGVLKMLAARGSCRAFLERPVPPGWLEVLSAVALASPTKSDLQQRDIVLVQDRSVRKRLVDLVPGQRWISDAPALVVFCGNNRRQRLLHEWQNVPFVNDHLDAFFNATGDAAIALGAFVIAAEAMGLGCCPISAVRNEAEAVSALLGLPDHVFPFAGLAIGFPQDRPTISKRLPLRVTCHMDRYREDNLEEDLRGYSDARAASQPYDKERSAEISGPSDTYGWAEDKVRQYGFPERAGFGNFVRAKGFKLK
ncbi:MAG: nitroreductase family protein [Pseudomonadota bacterium]